MQSIHVVAVCDSAHEAQHVVALLVQMSSAPAAVVTPKPTPLRLAPDTTPTTPAKPLTVVDVRTALTKYCNEFGADACRDRLSDFNVESVSNLKSEQYAAFIAAVAVPTPAAK